MRARQFASLRVLPAAWRRGLAIAGGVLLAGALLLAWRQPLGEWLWPQPRAEQLRLRAERALAAGRLSAADGSGARELYEAALALDPDQRAARAGLAKVARAALARAQAALDAGREDAVAADLQLAQALQAPQAEIARVQARWQARRAAQADIPALLAQAQAAQRAGHLDDGPQAALPLYQQVLALAPRNLAAAEGREDALAQLLQPAQAALAAGNVAAVAARIRRAEAFDPGHPDLPALRAGLARALEHRQQALRRALVRRHLVAASAQCLALRRDVPEAEPAECRGALVDALLVRVQRAAAHGNAAAARGLLQQAEALAGAADPRLRGEAARLAAPPAVAVPAPLDHRSRARVRQLLQQAARAQARGDWLTPPGESAWDRLRAARALAPADPAVAAALHALGPAARHCQAQALRDNRLAQAETCLDAWRQADPRAHAALAAAAQALAERWLAVADERLQAGELERAQQAWAHAAALDPQAPGLEALAQRLRRARPAER
ncbi:hypothetical protein [Thermomonas flagellata]|uniref:hypothetical protein n=1 Tax=Thermomonas flagellata TaxID=2888524 RepID=UPI001F047F90|nr:hypothetical protein [Thermomonas flagellata]